MNIKMTEDGLIIVPETEFEVKYLQNKYTPDKMFTAFLKTGLTITDVVGLIIIEE